MFFGVQMFTKILYLAGTLRFDPYCASRRCTKSRNFHIFFVHIFFGLQKFIGKIVSGTVRFDHYFPFNDSIKFSLINKSIKIRTNIMNSKKFLRKTYFFFVWVHFVKKVEKRYLYVITMLAVAEASFFCPKNVGFFNSKLGPVADANQRIIDFNYKIKLEIKTTTTTALKNELKYSPEGNTC